MLEEKILKLGCCGVVAHLDWGTSAQFSAGFTNAPLMVIQAALKKFPL
jgi:hypothetical protein